MTLRGFLGLAALLIAGSALAQPAREVNPLATRQGWEAGPEVSYYDYVEPGVAELSGPRVGGDGAGTLVKGPWFGRIEGRISYGLLKYEGSGTQTGVPDFILEVRGLSGWDIVGTSVSFSPYLGLGYRYLYDDTQGYSSTGAAGYRRYSNYLYLPVGATVRFRLGGSGWVLAPTLEYDVFLIGKQVSKLSDTGIAGLTDVTNTQKSGYGYRGSLMLEKNKWAFGVWMHYWHIDESDIQSAGTQNGIPVRGGEPENHTTEVGFQARYRF